MTETLETAADIQEIRLRLEAIEATQKLLVRERSESLLASYRTLFQSHRLLSETYRAVNGQRTQSEILDELLREGISISQPTLSRRMQTLLDNGLIEPVASGAPGKVFEQNRLVEQVLQLSKQYPRIESHRDSRRSSAHR